MDFPRIPHIFHSPSLAKTWITRAPRNSSHLVVVHPQLVGKAFQMNHTCWRDVLSRDDPMTSDDPTQRDFQEPNMENPLRNRKSCFFWHFIAGKDLEQHHLKNTVSARCWRQAATWRLVQLNFGSNSILGLLDPITSFNLQIFADLPWSAHTPFQYLPISSNIYFPIIYISSNNFQYLLIYIPYIYIYLPISSKIIPSPSTLQLLFPFLGTGDITAAVRPLNFQTSLRSPGVKRI